MTKPIDINRAKNRRTQKITQNLNALQVCVLTKPICLDRLDILLELTDVALRIVGISPDEPVDPS